MSTSFKNLIIIKTECSVQSFHLFIPNFNSTLLLRMKKYIWLHYLHPHMVIENVRDIIADSLKESKGLISGSADLEWKLGLFLFCRDPNPCLHVCPTVIIDAFHCSTTPFPDIQT